jgi:periplasmic divalent cation tolerance protein
MQETDYVLVMTTLPADADAAQFARSLVRSGSPPASTCCRRWTRPTGGKGRWNGKRSASSSSDLALEVAALWERVRELHPYDVPEFLVLPIVDGHEAYLRWVGESSREPR